VEGNIQRGREHVQFPKRKAILVKISEAKKLLMHPYFPEKVTSRATKETSDNGRQPRQDTEETIEVDMEGDEMMGDNTAEESEEQSRPFHTNTTAFNFNPNSSGIEASIYNFRVQDVPRTPSMTIFEDRVEGSSPIQQSTQTAMAVPKSIRYPGTQQVVTGVAYLVAEGFEHGSLTCSNILLNSDGDVKIGE